MDGIGRLLRRTWASGTGGSRGERKHSIAPGDARTFVNPACSASARLVKLYSNYVCDFVLCCFAAVVCRCFLALIYRRGVRYSTRDSPSCIYLPLSLFDLITVPLSLLHFIPLCGALVFLVLALSSYLGCLALLYLYMYMVAFLALRVLYVVALVYFAFTSWFFPS